jgi:catalase
MNEKEKENTIHNIVEAMKGISGPKSKEIINRQLCHWFRADEQLGMEVAKGLGVDVDEVMAGLMRHPEMA